ncbi:hypothetical protein PHOBOS_21 [Erwinia phage vB_EamM_Phobos]|uniref:DNA polymerase n=1 Tax=Erwinia phage vB_EamM_Phobos TaxID=1883377 RepID=UPI00081C576E|nr:DNA polymerase [Erwinia phage vB_EamM_Phobos]ANZ50211.1 hypothetical protein PHOBOS_21 [Erwinia phage vB_EamM_Phobos]
MEYDSPFRLSKEEYERDIDVVEAYFEQINHYIDNQTGHEYDIETIRFNVKEMFKPGGELEHKFPTCRIFVRNQKTGDREEKFVTIDKLFQTTIQRELISAPSLTFYLPETAKRSKLSEFMEQNVAKRAVIKGEMFAAKAAGNSVLHINKKNEQNAVKTLNNGSSGAFSSPYTILYNQSSHSVLTSTCRTATSFANAANERLLGGRRHYDTPRRVIDHFLSIGTLTDFREFAKVVEEFNLHIPTVDETMDMIHHSSTDYWINPVAEAKIRKYVENTPELERAAIVYMGDMYHLAKHNDAFMRGFMKALISKDVFDGDIQDWDAAARTIDGDMKIVISQFRTDVVPVGKSFGDVRLRDPETDKFLPWDQQDKFKELIRTGLFLQKTIGKYAKFIKVVLTNKNLPVNIARMPDVIRHVGVVSDTDSTMMTAQWWATWFSGSYFGEEATRVSDMIIYLATQHMRHLMASMSKNMGVHTDRIFLYAAKNEFKFDSFALTTKAKHYFSLITAQEGQLLEDPELEVKGVSLRTSNIPPVVMNEFKKTIKQFCKTVAAGNQIEIIPELQRVAAIEHEVVASLRAGQADYLKTTNIKDRSAYSDDDEKNYHYHRMYNTIFGPKYGYLDEPPYEAVRLPVNLENKTQIADWLASIEDPIIKAGAEKWFEETGGRKYTTLILPDQLVSNYGIPPDLIKAANVRRTAFATVEPYYHVLECLGVFMIDEDRTRLLSDYYGDAIE